MRDEKLMSEEVVEIIAITTTSWTSFQGIDFKPRDDFAMSEVAICQISSHSRSLFSLLLSILSRYGTS
jgi:hypothetical protein